MKTFRLGDLGDLGDLAVATFFLGPIVLIQVLGWLYGYTAASMFAGVGLGWGIAIVLGLVSRASEPTATSDVNPYLDVPLSDHFLEELDGQTVMCSRTGERARLRVSSNGVVTVERIYSGA